ncbi:ester cyclase [Actinokineospora sp.]|uniref:ester cyclase n=1 Tax=Actinokineospora sp. TaxID=1872133 RepID=UPI0040376744
MSTRSFGRQTRAFLGGLLGSASAVSADERRIRATLALLYRRFNAGDLDAAAALLSADYEGLDVASGEVVRGRAGWIQRQRANLGPLPDARTEIVRLYVARDVAVAEVLNQGTHTRPFPLPDGGEVPASGRKVSAYSAEIYRFRDGQIARGTLYYDFLTVARQLGLAP